MIINPCEAMGKGNKIYFVAPIDVKTEDQATSLRVEGFKTLHGDPIKAGNVALIDLELPAINDIHSYGVVVRPVVIAKRAYDKCREIAKMLSNCYPNIWSRYDNHFEYQIGYLQLQVTNPNQRGM